MEKPERWVYHMVKKFENSRHSVSRQKLHLKAHMEVWQKSLCLATVALLVSHARRLKIAYLLKARL